MCDLRSGLGVGRLAALKNLFWIGHGEQVQETRDDAGPSCLVTCAKTGPIVTVKILVERQAVAPVRIVLKRAGTAVDRCRPSWSLRKMLDNRREISSAT